MSREGDMQEIDGISSHGGDLHTSGYLSRRHCRRVLVKKKEKRKEKERKETAQLASAAALRNQQVHHDAASQPMFPAPVLI